MTIQVFSWGMAKWDSVWQLYGSQWTDRLGCRSGAKSWFLQQKIMWKLQCHHRLWFGFSQGGYRWQKNPGNWLSMAMAGICAPSKVSRRFSLLFEATWNFQSVLLVDNDLLQFFPSDLILRCVSIALQCIGFFVEKSMWLASEQILLERSSEERKLCVCKKQHKFGTQLHSWCSFGSGALKGIYFQPHTAEK